jgi:large subunit ribosomal protein L4
MQLQKLSPFSGAPARRQAVRVCASAVAQPAALPVKSADGSDKGTANLALRVAGEETAKALVHRYMVLVQQNARRVREH